jgi:hypothetical protein
MASFVALSAANIRAIFVVTIIDVRAHPFPPAGKVRFQTPKLP